MHPLAWIAIRALAGKNITQIDLDKGLGPRKSQRFSMGLGLMAVGAALAALGGMVKAWQKHGMLHP